MFKAVQRFSHLLKEALKSLSLGTRLEVETQQPPPTPDLWLVQDSMAKNQRLQFCCIALYKSTFFVTLHHTKVSICQIMLYKRIIFSHCTPQKHYFVTLQFTKNIILSRCTLQKYNFVTLHCHTALYKGIILSHCTLQKYRFSRPNGLLFSPSLPLFATY